MKKNTLRQAISFSIILLMAAAISLSMGYNRATEQAIGQTRQLLSYGSQQQISNLKSGSITILDAFAAELSTSTNLDSTVVLERSKLVKSVSGLSSVAYVNLLGALTSTEGFTADVSKSDYFKSAIDGQRFMGKTSDSTFYSNQVIFTSPILSAGKPTGFLVGVYEPSAFAQLLVSNAYSGKVSLLVAGVTGEIISSSDSKTLILSPYDTLTSFFDKAKLSDAQGAEIFNNMNSGTSGSIKMSINGTRQYMVYSPVGICGLYTFSLVDFSVIKEASFYSFATITVSLAVISLLAIAMFFAIASKESSALLALEAEKQQLQASEKEYKIAADHSNQMLFRFYPESGSVQLSEEIFAIQGLPRIIESSPELSIESGLIDSESAQGYLGFFHDIRSNKPNSKCEIKCNFSTGTSWYDMDYTMLASPKGTPYAVISAVDVTDRKNAEEKILKRSMEDSLTGALNRKAFEQSAINLLKQSNNEIHAMIMLDIDDFKAINDNFGHIMGDNVLFDTCSRLRTLLKDGDILGRPGGDEFMMLLKNINPNEQAQLNARLQDMVNVVHKTIKGETKVTASLGVSIYPKDGKTFSELYRTSDIAVYAAKSEGRNKFVLYHTSMEDAKSKKK